MFLKFITFFLLLIIIKYVSSKSFTVVIDTTVSMEIEIQVVKTNIRTLVDAIDEVADIKNYILVPFNDPDMGPTSVSVSSEDFLDSVNGLTVSGGRDCPENSLAGIQKALEISQPESFIFVFTDANAKDISRSNVIQNLCRNTGSQVVIFLSGGCESSGSRFDAGVYYDVTKICNGILFRVDPLNLRQAFKFMKEVINIEWTNIKTHQSFIGDKEFIFSVDSFTKDYIIAVSGEYPLPQVVDAEGQTPRIAKIVDTKHTVAIRLINPQEGDYKLNIRCQGITSMTFYMKKDFPFTFGFSTKLPNCLKETSGRPIPGQTNYILIVVPPEYRGTKIIIIYVQFDGREKETLTIEKTDEELGFSIAKTFFEPNKSFRISVVGQHESPYKESSWSTKKLKPQDIATKSQWLKPTTEIIEPQTNLIGFGMNTSIACRISGYPKPNIWWEDDNGRTLTSEDTLLEIPTLYISYVTIEMITANSTFYCKAKSSQGDDQQSIELFVNRTNIFEEIQTPTDETIEYGEEGKLFCEINAYPEAEINWYHNETLIENADNIKIIPDEHVLIIKNMSFNEVGDYACEVNNSVESRTFSATVTISGIEAPEVQVLKSEVILKPGDWIELECSIVKGKPTPAVTWKYISDDVTDLPEGVYVNENKIKIPEVKSVHRGVYICEASNILGKDSKEIEVKIQYAPIINSNDVTELIVREEDNVELTCEVNADPEATVQWEKNDAIITSGRRHSIDDQHTLRFIALWEDSGEYRCIAENDIGRSEKTINVDVWVAPYIEPPESKTVTVKSGDSVTLNCKILYGNPVPFTKWQFIALDSTTTVLSRGKASRQLHIPRVTRRHEGTYLCVADNEVSSDNIRVHLKVQK